MAMTKTAKFNMLTVVGAHARAGAAGVTDSVSHLPKSYMARSDYEEALAHLTKAVEVLMVFGESEYPAYKPGGASNSPSSEYSSCSYTPPTSVQTALIGPTPPKEAATTAEGEGGAEVPSIAVN